jgi:DDE superfamily endonuclease
LSYCPRSSLPVEVLAWLARRLAYLIPPRPPGLGGNRPLALEVRLDAVAAVILDGLSYRRAGRMVGISKTEVGDSMDLLLPKLAALGCCQPDGTFITTLDDVGERLVEMANAGEAVCVDGLAVRVQRPSGWANQKVLYDAKRHAHTAQGVALSTIHGDLLWVDGGWPGSCHEHELLVLSGLGEVLDATDVATILDRGFRGLAKGREHWHAPVGDRRTKDRLTGYGPWWSRRSVIWPTPGRCAAGAGCCTGSAISSGPLVRWYAWAAGCTASPDDQASRTPSMTGLTR